MKQPSMISFPLLLLLFLQFSQIQLLQCMSLLQQNQTDKNSLLAFESQITEDPFHILSSWNESSHFCQWSGVTCGRRHQRVTKLQLPSYSLAGSLSPHIGNLSFLGVLHLKGNKLSKIIPPELGRLFRLQYLSLYGNMFVGGIPANISRCSKLKILYLGGNRQLSGRLPEELGSLGRLREINFQFNHMVGKIPASFGNLSSLEKFYGPDNHLHGSIPDTLGQLKKLKEFAFGLNNLSGTLPPSMCNLTSISIFSLTANQLTGSLPSNLFQSLPHLELFEITQNHFSGLVPGTLSNASYLTRFAINFNNFTGKFPNLNGSQDLRIFYIGDNYLGEGENSDDLKFLYPLANKTSLEELDLNGNNFGGTIPGIICNFSSKLNLLAFGSNKLQGSIPSEIGNLQSLAALGFEKNQLTGDIPSSIGKLGKLIVLSVRENQLSGSIPSSLGNITLLEEFHGGFNNLQGGIPPSLENWKHLLLLGLQSNNLSGPLQRDVVLGISFSIIYLYLSDNQLTAIPSEIAKLVNLEYLDISRNKLSGEIPGSLGSCMVLEVLLLEENFFQGTIPISFKSLRGLQYLNLSRNNLSGQIPTFLGDLKVLNLDLSFNNFDGEVPMEGIFQNESAFSVTGNKNLCGGVIKLHLPKCGTNKSTGKKFSATLKFKISVACGTIGVALMAIVMVMYASRGKLHKPAFLLSEGISFPQVSYEDLLKATEGFSPGNLIGTGSFGSVYKGVLKFDEIVVAVKVLNLLQKGAAKSFMAECAALVNIRHRNLVKVLTSCSSIDFQGNDFKALVYEYMANGSLEKWLHPIHMSDQVQHPRYMNLVQRLNVAIDVASALEYLHHGCQTTLVHCDLKPSNVLLDSDMTAHVGDFGLARFLPKDNDHLVPSNLTSSIGIKGTVGYAAPEYGVASEVSTHGDAYSYGILLLETFTGKEPTNGMFGEGLSLHNFVKMALPDHAARVADPMLFRQDNQESVTGEATPSKLIHARESDRIMECLVSILTIGVACSAELRKDRMEMKNVVPKLHQIKEALYRAVVNQRT